MNSLQPVENALQTEEKTRTCKERKRKEKEKKNKNEKRKKKKKKKPKKYLPVISTAKSTSKLCCELPKNVQKSPLKPSYELNVLRLATN